jgi:hypothetical protein
MSRILYYRGGLSDPARLGMALETIESFCGEQGWNFVPVEDEIQGLVEPPLGGLADPTLGEGQFVTDQIQGLVIYPHRQIDPAWFGFNREGALCQYILVSHGEYLRRDTFSIDTTRAPLDTHAALCELLTLLGRELMPGLGVFDESGYYESGQAGEDEATAFDGNEPQRRRMRPTRRQFRQAR